MPGVTPWLSVVLPVHGGERHLDPTLASVAAEQPEGVEFLVYDSGKDGGASRRIAESYSDRLDISWQDRPEIVSWTAKTNLGVSEARAGHVAMLHQDDLWLPGHLAQVKAALEADPAAALSIGPSRFVSDTGRLLGPWHLPFPAGTTKAEDFIATLLVQNTIAIPSPVIRRDAWLASGGLDDALWYTADWDLYLKLAQAGPVRVRPQLTTAFRLHGSSLTMSGRRDMVAFREQLEVVLVRYLDSVPGERRKAVERRARASIEINCALASASAGSLPQLATAARAVLGLGIGEIRTYLNQSRIVDRVAPRLRLALTGSL